MDKSIHNLRGTNHPDKFLPPVPPSLDESIIYNNHVQMFLRLPNKLSSNGIPAEEFWKELCQRNKCSPKFGAKMLCALHVNKFERENFLEYINSNDHIWHNETIKNDNKLTLVLNNILQPFMFCLTPLMEEKFLLLNPFDVVNKVYLMSVELSVVQLFEKNLHANWLVELKQKYNDLVGDHWTINSDAKLITYLLWIPAISTFYLPFARTASVVEMESIIDH